MRKQPKEWQDRLSTNKCREEARRRVRRAETWLGAKQTQEAVGEREGPMVTEREETLAPAQATPGTGDPHGENESP